MAIRTAPNECAIATLAEENAVVVFDVYSLCVLTADYYTFNPSSTLTALMQRRVRPHWTGYLKRAITSIAVSQDARD